MARGATLLWNVTACEVHDSLGPCAFWCSLKGVLTEGDESPAATAKKTCHHTTTSGKCEEKEGDSECQRLQEDESVDWEDGPCEVDSPVLVISFVEGY